MPVLDEDGGKDRQFVTALARGLDVLRAFRAGDDLLGNHEIAARAGLPRPTVVRLAHTLAELGYLTYVRRLRKHRLAPSALALGCTALANLDVRQVASGPIQQLAQALDCTVALGGRDRNAMICLESHSGATEAGVTCAIATRLSMAATDMGRAWLAIVPEPRKNQLMEQVRRGWRGDWDDIRRRIDGAAQQIAERGFCLSWDDQAPGVCGVGAPLRCPDGETCFSFGILARSGQVSREQLEQQWAPRLVRLARDVRNNLAGRASQADRHRRFGRG
jgi:DNA-binding IclR family transcriptional regulator